MDTNDPEEARSALGNREGVRPHLHRELIGLWNADSAEPNATITDLPSWARSRHIENVIWTNLPHNFHGRDANRVATATEVVAYLADLKGEVRESAKRYILNAPPQIDTEIRRAIEAELGWRVRSDD